MFSESYGNAVVRAISSAGRAFYEAPPAGFAEAPLMTPRGFLFIARADQEDSLRLYRRLDELPDCTAYAKQHLDIIARFGRFPHRNAILGRQSTPEEADFLKQEGSSF